MIILYFLLAVLSPHPIQAEETPLPWISSGPVLPSYVSLAPNINDFTRFADGGPDANWYVGFNNAWIVKLPAAPRGEFSRAFIGAKVGRAKTRPNPDKPWLREVISGKIYMGLSPASAFSSQQSYFLTDTSDIPLEADNQSSVDGSGASEWFWAEVPLASINFSGPNYLAIWSPTNYFQLASSAPILAAAPIDEAASRETRAWNNRSISGVPPRIASTALETPVGFSPALAIKLVPPGSDEVGIAEFSARAVGKKYIVEFSVGGENISEAWVESSKDQLDWGRITRVRRRPPYLFTIPADKFPSPGEYLRGAARDISGDVGRGDAFAVPFPARPK